uniref:Membrane-bound O-acyltransferase domain-containing protein 2-like isoform X2 n=1 Tax=Geotrypetes seraphini TaxID=260995 RepID=A0A6P8RWA1_GEOSA|nr:membrane-bound O-acyltransferase domain-containing protein 2-like isoform X2 [Geotrypetes seraphini]
MVEGNRYTVLIFGEVVLSYIILLMANRTRVHIYSLVVAMSYLTIFQVDRLLNSSEESFDFTVPMMILTQKITKVAFELHDGTARKPESLSPSQTSRALRKLPSLLEYLSYNFNFMGILAGPVCSYNDYVAFIEGRHYQRSGDSEQVKENGVQKRPEPSPTNAVLEKLGTCFLLLGIHVAVSKAFPVAYNTEESYVKTTPLLHRLFYLYVSLAACRPKYYVAWTLADTINNAAGFGFNGYRKDGKPRWDLIQNLSILKIELATSMKMFLDNWNIQTALWLKEICYDRCNVSPTLATFVLSAVWHGVHPGYYLTFLTGMLMTLAARAVRRNFRHHFLISPSRRIFYDMVTWAATQITVSYTVAPFILLYLGPSFKFYRSCWFCLHLLALLLILLLPKKRQAPSRETTGTLLNAELQQNGSIHHADSNGKQAKKML